MIIVIFGIVHVFVTVKLMNITDHTRPTPELVVVIEFDDMQKIGIMKFV